MIIISRKAWYMRFYRTIHASNPDNLCMFARNFIGAVLLHIFLVVILAGIIWFLLLAPAYALGFFHDGFIMSLSLITDGFLLAIFIRSFTEQKRYKDRWMNANILPELRAPTLFTLLYKYIVAIHDKTCPLIKVE